MEVEELSLEGLVEKYNSLNEKKQKLIEELNRTNDLMNKYLGGIEVLQSLNNKEEKDANNKN